MAQGKITCPVCVLSTFNYNTVVVFPLQGPSFPHAVMLSVPQNKATSNMTSGGTHFLPGLFDLVLLACGPRTRQPFFGTGSRLEANLPT